MIIYGTDWDVVSFKPSYSSAITWKQVGQTLVSYDSGLVSDKWGSVITLTGAWDQLQILYNYLNTNVYKTITMSSTEYCFGPQFDYSGNFSVIVRSVEQPVMKYRDVGEVTVTFDTVLTGKYINLGIDFDLNQFTIPAITRKQQKNGIVQPLEIGYNTIDDGTILYTTNIKVRGKRTKIGRLLRSLQVDLRDELITSVTNELWLFNPMVNTCNLKVISISNLQPIDIASNWWEFDLEVVRQ